MRAFPSRLFLAAAFAAGIVSSQAQAQGREPAGDGTNVVVRQYGEQITGTETRVRGGVVTDIAVNRGGNSYHLKPASPIGTALPGGADSNALRGAQWGVWQFDFGGSAREAKPPVATQAPAPMPPAAR